MSPEYWALAVSLGRPAAPDAVEAVTNFLWEAGALGVVEEAAGEVARLRAFFPSSADPVALRARLGRYLDELRALAIAIGPGAVEAERLPDEPWADAWRAHFRPLAVGRRLLVCPPWDVPAGDRATDRLVVMIEPGRAFGTGGHATTRGCLELIERALADGNGAPTRVLDVGTGSGVLAIAAARLGAHEVCALDLDPDAVAAARANAERNEVAARVRVELAPVETWRGPSADLVLANLLGATHVALARVLAGCCGVPGRLIAGGILAHEGPAVLAAYASEGFALEATVECEEWATVLMGRSR